MKFNVEDEVWIKYYDKKAYRGVVNKIQKIGNDVLVTVLTEERGYRTVKEEMCSWEKPSRKDLDLLLDR